MICCTCTCILCRKIVLLLIPLYTAVLISQTPMFKREQNTEVAEPYAEEVL